MKTMQGMLQTISPNNPWNQHQSINASQETTTTLANQMQNAGSWKKILQIAKQIGRLSRTGPRNVPEKWQAGKVEINKMTKYFSYLAATDFVLIIQLIDKCTKDNTNNSHLGPL